MVPSQDIFDAELRRMPERVKLTAALRAVIRDQISRGVPSGELTYLDTVVANAQAAIVAYDRQLRQQWDALKAENAQVREAEAQYWARLNRSGAQNVSGRGVGLGFVVVFLIVGVIIALGATGVFWDWMRRHENGADARARDEMNAKYAFMAEQVARVSNLTGSDLAALARSLIAEQDRAPSAGELAAGTVKSIAMPAAIAAGIGLLWLFLKGNRA